VTVTGAEYLKIALDVKAFSKKVQPQLYQILLMTGSNIVISTTIKAYLAGLQIPLEIDVTLLDPAKMEIPVKAACGKKSLNPLSEGSKICDKSGYGEVSVGSKLTGYVTSFTLSAKACQAMCSGANTVSSNKAALKAKIDVVEAIKVPLEAANIAGISVLLNYLVLGKIDACDAGLGKDDGASLTLSFAVLFILAVTSALSY